MDADAPTTSPTKLLVIEDDQDIARGLELMLAGEYTVRSAMNSGQAFSVCETMRPDLLIVDYGLPGMNGLDLIDALRRSMGQEIPAIMISAHVERMNQSIRSGVDAFISKPFDWDQLRSAISRALRRGSNRKRSGGA